MTFDDLLCHFVGSSMLKQQLLNNFLGQHSWEVDMYQGKVSFGTGRLYPMQVLGTESEVNHTWLWAWANSASDIPPALTENACQLREYGVKERVKEFTTGEIPLQQIDGYPIALVASGLCSASAFYRGPYEGGAIFFTMSEIPLPQPTTIDMVNALTKVITAFPLDHRQLAQSFLEQQGFSLAETGGQLEGSGACGTISLSFDEAGRIADMQTTSKAPAPNSSGKKAWWKFGRD